LGRHLRRREFGYQENEKEEALTILPSANPVKDEDRVGDES
jgi:hypothetical protein